jgi:hypothetical protein
VDIKRFEWLKCIKQVFKKIFEKKPEGRTEMGKRFRWMQKANKGKWASV